MSTLEIILSELPPSLNNLYSTIEVKGHSRRVLSSAANDWKRSAGLIIRNAATLQEWTCARKTPLFIEIIFASPTVLKWDIDGKPKLLLDAFCEAMGLDDRYVMSLNLMKARSGLEQVQMRVGTGEVQL